VTWLYLHLPLALALIGFGVAKAKMFGSLDGDLSDAYVWLYVGAVAAVCTLLVLLSAPRGRVKTALRAGAAVAVFAIGAAGVAVGLTPVPIAVAVGAVIVALVGIEVAGERTPTSPTVPAVSHDAAKESGDRQ
jgi:hypothetical protein